ncbi:hypothetical protein [Sphingobacterium sp. BIGb0165]|uniref:hypothetical protein n=1 Tax=Sphingobacterium sp. BIGb0165 TaxID=2940615 RepID=UPI0021688068|nr:hypothetical protein [Sphingobacterium sp. BIGb0165]MCS4229069.1 glucan phosphoethanolaminetransferase (alkaline phosphatase superfamily) [Sphingobacterium sp. BIGb0165]
MSTSKLCLIVTLVHISLAILVFSYLEKLSSIDLDELGILLVFGLVILAFILAIKSRQTTLGVLMLVANSIFLMISLVLLYFALTFTFRV